MAVTSYSVDEQGNITSRSNPEITKSNHAGMPSREGYQADHDRGHIEASSLGGSNEASNIVSMQRDVNRIDYRAMERGETEVLKNGGQIESEKIAYVGSNVGNTPTAFMVNDTVIHPDGTTHEVHESFSNISHAEQMEFNTYLENHSELNGEYPNPNDTLRDSMTPQEYADLMGECDKAMAGVKDDYSFENHSYTPENSFEAQFGQGAHENSLEMGNEGSFEAEYGGAEYGGAEASGAEASGVEASGAEASGAEASGAEASGAEASGAEASGAEADPD